MSEPALDELPGSLQNGTPDQEKEKEDGEWSADASAAVPAAGRAAGARRRGAAAGRAGSGEEKRRRTKRKPTQRQLQQEEVERRTVAKHERQSNILLALSGLPVAGILLWNHLAAVELPHLSIDHTRIPSYHYSSLASKCLRLSYQLPLSTFATPPGTDSTSSFAGHPSLADSDARYLKGTDDLFLVGFAILLITLVREIVIRFLWAPLARAGGITKHSTLQRFGEQGYTLVYCAISWTFGLWMMQNSEYRNMHIPGLVHGYPHYKMPWQMKGYYLIQAAFWLQQILAINIEKRRKDYLQMFSHHIITVLLIYYSYIYNFTRFGNVVLVLMDVCDLILGIAKMLKYLHYTIICDVLFVVFMVVWLVTRNMLFPRLLYAVAFEMDTLEYRWDPENEYFWTKGTQTAFIALLGSLQVLLVLWFFLIVKVAYSVVRGNPAEDSRSDDEDEEEVAAVQDTETADDDSASTTSDELALSPVATRQGSRLSQSHPMPEQPILNGSGKKDR